MTSRLGGLASISKFLNYTCNNFGFALLLLHVPLPPSSCVWHVAPYLQLNSLKTWFGGWGMGILTPLKTQNILLIAFSTVISPTFINERKGHWLRPPNDQIFRMQSNQLCLQGEPQPGPPDQTAAVMFVCPDVEKCSTFNSVLILRAFLRASSLGRGKSHRCQAGKFTRAQKS